VVDGLPSARGWSVVLERWSELREGQHGRPVDGVRKGWENGDETQHVMALRRELGRGDGGD
jgi:hypothetical protein